MFIFDENKNYRMPPFFGGVKFDSDYEARVNNVLNINFTILTDGQQLANYLPKGFQLLRPELIITYNQLRDVEFMFGGSYNLIQISVPTRFNGLYDQLEGTFPLVIWENNTRPIIGGREESGQPKIYADIEDLHRYQDNYFTNASYEGNTFLNLEILNPQPLERCKLDEIKASSKNYNVFGWRYIPKVGAPGADLSQPILYPQSMKVRNAWIGKGDVQWTKLSNNYHYVDAINKYTDVISQYEIINALTELPIKSIQSVMLIKGAIIMKPYAGRVLR